VLVYIHLCKYKQDNEMVSQALAQEISELEADFCFALSDPTRLLMIYALADGPHNVTELASELNVIQPTASRHLKILRDRGLVYTVRQRTTVTYHLADPRLIQALDLLRTVMRERLAHRAGLMVESESAST
jgi:DNA-binding transcriptional ArsR family regulator